MIRAREALGLSVGRSFSGDDVSKGIGIKRGQYFTFENGRRPDREVLDALCDYYQPFAFIIEDLRTSYDAQFGPRLVVQPAIISASEHQEELVRRIERDRPVGNQGTLLEEMIGDTRDRIVTAYHRDELRRAEDLAATVWPTVLAYAPNTWIAQGFASAYARIASQTGNHVRALQIINDLRQRQSHSAQPLARSWLSLSMVSCTTRAFDMSGIRAARSYERFMVSIQQESGIENPECSSQWKWVWNSAYRNLVISLTDSPGDKEQEYLKRVQEGFRRSMHGTVQGHYTWSNEVVSARILALNGNPDNALCKIDALALNAKDWGDKAFAARARILALQAGEQFDQAIGETDEWTKKCVSRGLGHNLQKFQVLRGSILTKWEKFSSNKVSFKANHSRS